MAFVVNPHLLPKVRSRALLQAVRNMPCTLRVSTFYPGHLCSSQDTVVPCHLDRTIGKGIGTKVSDLFVAAGCDHCHAIIDGRDIQRMQYIIDKYPSAYAGRLLQGLAETQSRWVDMGILTGDDWEVVK